MRRAIFSIATLVLSVASASAGLVYNAKVCTPGVNCTIGSHGTSSGSGPSNADFRTFFSTQLGVDLSSDNFTWETKSNANGYFFGHVDDATFNIHTAYLWNGSSLQCCTLDEPYAITDGNDHNMFIGIDPAGVSNAGQPLSPAFLAGPGGPLGLAPLSYTLTPEALALIGDAWLSVAFQSIDNSNKILASWSGSGMLLFTPVATPEPAAALLLLPALLMMRRFRRR
jgi:hypothetical protein